MVVINITQGCKTGSKRNILQLVLLNAPCQYRTGAAIAFAAANFSAGQVRMIAYKIYQQYTWRDGCFYSFIIQDKLYHFVSI